MTASKQSSDSGWKRSSKTCMKQQCRMYSRKLLMMGTEDARKDGEFYNRISLGN